MPPFLFLSIRNCTNMALCVAGWWLTCVSLLYQPTSLGKSKARLVVYTHLRSYSWDSTSAQEMTSTTAAFTICLVATIGNALPNPLADEQIPDWGYTGDIGPANWASLNEEYEMCSSSQYQSPVDVVDNATVQVRGQAVALVTMPSSIARMHHFLFSKFRSPLKKCSSLLMCDTPRPTLVSSLLHTKTAISSLHRILESK